ncbi:MAG: DUF4834 family protein [Phocaeicola plebeius]|nr:DUF4834 family protein [Phocaeicola plebeius]
MFHLIGFLFFLVLVVVVLGLALVSRVIGTLLGWGRKASDAFSGRSSAGASSASSSRSATPPPSASSKKKVFDDDEGEYIDFEEID